ncbi:Uncharacterised protein [Mycobacteroides abscessus subsp. abscessus]|nr:Uncharacterised protein [Mycobacteroides abscessus]SHU47711.1 Uncharacterised protein [Mycobacteroides abscessus subsp. abscessus]SKV24330.1 Uncharacterised protein [Mycobacteroides abscessus subsp. abscessus]SLE64121.1 Uncharacterised protein [Mycobacteroides abscessus subsp. massiliense]
MRVRRPARWLMGMKFTPMDGITSSVSHFFCHKLATSHCGYMAPLGVPVLPEV